MLEGLAEEARAGFGELIEQFPGTAYAAEAQFSLAELLEAEERLRDALKAYQGLTDYPKPELVQEKIDRLKARITKKKKVL